MEVCGWALRGVSPIDSREFACRLPDAGKDSLRRCDDDPESVLDQSCLGEQMLAVVRSQELRLGVDRTGYDQVTGKAGFRAGRGKEDERGRWSRRRSSSDSVESMRSEDAGGTQAFDSTLRLVVDVFVWPDNDDEADGVRVEHAIDGSKSAAALDCELQGAEVVERALEGVSCQGILLQSAQRLPDLLTVLAKLLEILLGAVSQLDLVPPSRRLHRDRRSPRSENRAS